MSLHFGDYITSSRGLTATEQGTLHH